MVGGLFVGFSDSPTLINLGELLPTSETVTLRFWRFKDGMASSAPETAWNTRSKSRSGTTGHRGRDGIALVTERADYLEVFCFEAGSIGNLQVSNWIFLFLIHCQLPEPQIRSAHPCDERSQFGVLNYNSFDKLTRRSL
jgi:hypothetical protein